MHARSCAVVRGVAWICNTGKKLRAPFYPAIFVGDDARGGYPPPPTRRYYVTPSCRAVARQRRTHHPPKATTAPTSRSRHRPPPGRPKPTSHNSKSVLKHRCFFLGNTRFFITGPDIPQSPPTYCGRGAPSVIAEASQIGALNVPIPCHWSLASQPPGSMSPTPGGRSVNLLEPLPVPSPGHHPCHTGCRNIIKLRESAAPRTLATLVDVLLCLKYQRFSRSGHKGRSGCRNRNCTKMLAAGAHPGSCRRRQISTFPRESSHSVHRTGFSPYKPAYDRSNISRRAASDLDMATVIIARLVSGIDVASQTRRAAAVSKPAFRRHSGDAGEELWQSALDPSGRQQGKGFHKP